MFNWGREQRFTAVSEKKESQKFWKILMKYENSSYVLQSANGGKAWNISPIIPNFHV